MHADSGDLRRPAGYGRALFGSSNARPHMFRPLGGSERKYIFPSEARQLPGTDSLSSALSSTKTQTASAIFSTSGQTRSEVKHDFNR